MWPIDSLDYRYISTFTSAEKITNLHELNRKDLALGVRREWFVERHLSCHKCKIMDFCLNLQINICVYVLEHVQLYEKTLS